MEAFEGWGQLMSVCLPIAAVFYIEATCYFINFLFVGWLHDDIQMASHTALSSLADLFWMIPGGCEGSLYTHIGNSAGAGKKKTAINYTITGLAVAVVIVLLEFLFFFFTKSWFAEIFLAENPEFLLRLFTVFNFVMQVPDNITPALKGVLYPMLKGGVAMKIFFVWFGVCEIVLALFLEFYVGMGVFGVWVSFGTC
jgi:Na+-driven multidrug efflux pump